MRVFHFIRFLDFMNHTIPADKVDFNDTIDELLGLCNPKSFVVILGGSTPLSPILFDYGIDAIAGTIVTNPEMVLQYVSQGATFRQIKGIKLVTMFKDMLVTS